MHIWQNKFWQTILEKTKKEEEETAKDRLLGPESQKVERSFVE